MFFQNIQNWSKKLMWTVTALCYIAYFGLIVLAPIITIMVKYQVFSKAEETATRITGFGLVVFVVFGLAAYIFFKKAVTKLPKVSVNEQRFRFGLECLFDCLPLGIALYSLFVVKDDINLAFSTAKYCLIFFLAGTLWNNLFIKFIDAEWEIRQGAKLDKEKEKRKGVV